MCMDFNVIKTLEMGENRQGGWIQKFIGEEVQRLFRGWEAETIPANQTLKEQKRTQTEI